MNNMITAVENLKAINSDLCLHFVVSPTGRIKVFAEHEVAGLNRICEVENKRNYFSVDKLTNDGERAWRQYEFTDETKVNALKDNGYFMCWMLIEDNQLMDVWNIAVFVDKSGNVVYLKKDKTIMKHIKLLFKAAGFKRFHIFENL